MQFVRRIYLSLVYLFALVWSGLLWGEDIPLNENALWLPIKYQGHYIQLVGAAQAALDLPRCVEVKQARLDLRQSTPGRTMFRILCRQASGKTYTEMIGGEGFLSLTPEKSSVVACHKLLLEETQMMIDLSWVADTSEAADGRVGPDGDEHYRWDFNAKALDGEMLHYSAECFVSAGGAPSLSINARRKSK